MFDKTPDDQPSKIQAAIAFLNNHIPVFGVLHPHDEEIGGSTLLMEDVPPKLSNAVECALVSAALCLERYFDED